MASRFDRSTIRDGDVEGRSHDRAACKKANQDVHFSLNGRRSVFFVTRHIRGIGNVRVKRLSGLGVMFIRRRFSLPKRSIEEPVEGPLDV